MLASGGAADSAATGDAAPAAGFWRRWRVLLKSTGLCLLVGMAACSDSVPLLAPLDAGAVILAFGDSLTYGTGAGKGNSYPDALQRLSGFDVINAGKPGGEWQTYDITLVDRHVTVLWRRQDSGDRERLAVCELLIGQHIIGNRGVFVRSKRLVPQFKFWQSR